MVTDKLAKIVGFKVKNDGSTPLSEDIMGLTCDVSELLTRLNAALAVGAQLLEFEGKPALTDKERKAYSMLAEELEYHLRAIEEKCGVKITREQLILSLKRNPDLLDEISKAMKTPGT